MNPIVKKDILNTLQQAVDAIKKENLYKLRDLSDHVINNAAIFQDKDSISIAVTIYSLSKIYKDPKHVDDFVLPHLINAIKYLEEGEINKYESEIKQIIKDMTKHNLHAKYYIQEVLERSQIKKASKMFEHGISMTQVAESLGISLWDIMEYVGKTHIIDKFDYKTDIKSKLEFTRGLFQ
jgi:hypothetical protein